MSWFLLCCVIHGILGGTFLQAKPTFSEGLGRKKLCCGRDRAPPARRIASYARSYVCFGPMMPMGFARERFGACLDIELYQQGGRARLSQA
ncbi:hypothetical protein ABOC32_19485 [Pseudomonas sp. WOUb67]|uniref:hypothetical protein n=1 Tax=Pseudomonas sp. WOUb67 TaxID=3161136 RepID=UPI003CF57AA2